MISYYTVILFSLTRWSHSTSETLHREKQFNQNKFSLKHLLQLVICDRELTWKMIDSIKKGKDVSKYLYLILN